MAIHQTAPRPSPRPTGPDLEGHDVTAYTESKTRAELEALVGDGGRGPARRPRGDQPQRRPRPAARRRSGHLGGAGRSGCSTARCRRRRGSTSASSTCATSPRCIVARDERRRPAASASSRRRGTLLDDARSPTCCGRPFPRSPARCRASQLPDWLVRSFGLFDRDMRDNIQATRGAPKRIDSQRRGSAARPPAHPRRGLAAARHRAKPHRPRPRLTSRRARKKGLGHAERLAIYARIGDGAVAQLGERVVRNDEVSGSIPLSSTTRPLNH